MSESKKRIEEIQKALKSTELSQKDIIKLQKEYNDLLQEQIDKQRESYDISSSMVDAIKETLGINIRRTTTSSNLLKINKSINNQILDQVKGSYEVNEINKQINSNAKLLEKAKVKILSLEKKVSEEGKERANNVNSELGQIRAKEKLIQAELSKTKEQGGVDLSIVAALKQQIIQHDAAIDKTLSVMSASEKQLAFTMANRKALKEQNKERQKDLQNANKFNKKLGLAGGLLKGINKIPILGDIVDSNSALDDMKKHITDGGSATGALGKGVKNVSKQMVSGLQNPANTLLGIFTAMISTLTKADTNAGEYAKSMNMTYEEAANTQMEMSRIANLSGDVALTGEKLLKTNQKVGAALGTNAQLNQDDLETMTKLTHQAGFQADELMNIQKLSLAQGKSLKANTKAILGGAKEYARRNKIAVNEKTILKEVNNMSAALKLSLGGSGDAMAKAATEAKAFGINLQQAEKISESLLNFEQSIEDELSAELLTGKDLNFEKARSLALNGDAAGAAKEILKQAQDLTEEQLKNPIIMGQMAKAAGITREELAASIIESKALKNIGVESVEEAQKEYEILKEKHGAEKAAKMLGDEALAAQFEQQSVQEQMAESTAKMQEIFIMMTPALVAIGQAMGVVANLVATMMKPIQFMFDFFGKIGKRISGLIGPLGKVGKVLKGLASLAVVYAAYKAYASLATIPIVGVPLGIAAAAAVTATGMGLLSSIKDGVVDPKGGIVMQGEKGTIQLDKEDSVVAGTDLFGKKKEQSVQQSSPQPSPQPQGGTDMTAILNAINALATRPINVQVGEEVVVKAAVGNSPNVTGDEMGKNSYQLN